MRILIVAATAQEIAPLVAKFKRLSPQGPRITIYAHAGYEIAALTTGVGMVATATWCSRVLVGHRFSGAAGGALVLNAGLCGSFDPALPPGTVVHVVDDRIAELGAEDGDAFLSIDDLQLPSEHQFVNAAPPKNEALARLATVRGITVNTVHGHEPSIAAAVERCHPQVESMEGAAFMHACTVHGVPFAQVRAVSNVVERRNRDAWKIDEAIDALNAAVLDIIECA